jgi:hypothetical protein
VFAVVKIFLPIARIFTLSSTVPERETENAPTKILRSEPKVAVRRLIPPRHGVLVSWWLVLIHRIHHQVSMILRLATANEKAL